MEHGHDEADALTQSNEADHDRHNDGQKPSDLIEDTGQHGAGDDAGENGSGSGDFLKAALLSYKNS